MRRAPGGSGLVPGHAGCPSGRPLRLLAWPAGDSRSRSVTRLTGSGLPPVVPRPLAPPRCAWWRAGVGVSGSGVLRLPRLWRGTGFAAPCRRRAAVDLTCRTGSPFCIFLLRPSVRVGSQGPVSERLTRCASGSVGCFQGSRYGPSGPRTQIFLAGVAPSGRFQRPRVKISRLFCRVKGPGKKTGSECRRVASRSGLDRPLVEGRPPEIGPK